MVYCPTKGHPLPKQERSVLMNSPTQVLISMNAVSRTDLNSREPDEPIRMLVPGRLTIENGIYMLRYQETQQDENGDVVGVQNITLTMAPGRVTMTREGAFGTTMVFVRGQRFEGAYHTPYGDLEMAVYATKVDCRLAPHAGTVNLQYTLDMQGAFAAMNTLELTYAVNTHTPS